MTDGYEYLQRAEVEQLERWMQERIDSRTDLRRRVENLDKEIALHQAELDRRALDAWWAAHPEQTRVNVGDRFAATRSLFRYREQTGGWPKSNDEVELGAIGVVIGVEQVGKFWSISFDKYMSTGLIPLHIIQDMCRAYLAAHPESEADR